MSENIEGIEARRLIDDAFDEMGGRPGEGDGWMLLRRDSADDRERRHFERIASSDNNYSYLNTASRNPQYSRHRPRDMDVYRRSNRDYATSYNWELDE
jgi:hypothetical protein